MGSAVLLAVGGTVFALTPTAQASVPFAVEALDGSGNNVNHPTWGQANTPYARVGTAHYADGISQPVSGVNARFTSDRVISDANQNVFSERRLSGWAWTWGQFLDHTFGLREANGSTATAFNIPFSATDPMETFHSNLNVIPVNRSAASPGTGTSTTNPRQQTNTLPSYLSANTVYGATNARLDWLRSGSLDGNPTNNSALLMLPGGYLPDRNARGNPSAAPTMDSDGRLLSHPNDGVVAGDARANENLQLTATHTLFAREHNRIVSLLPSSLSDEDKFQIARRVVMAEEQYITYQEWLPAMGVNLPKYAGYNPNVNSAISNEFATTGYRAHSQIHGDGLEVEAEVGDYTQAQLDAFTAAGAEVEVNGSELIIAVPLGLMFFNPTLLKDLGEDNVLASIGGEMQYNNDIQIDNQLRSILFQVPSSTDTSCLNGPTTPDCFNVVNDLGAIDIVRARDHGIGTYNQLRAAYGLAAKTSFTAITGESTEAFPSDPLLTAGNEINDPNSLDVLALKNIDGANIDLNGDPAIVSETATKDVRRTTVAARLKAIYGNVNNVDAFVGVSAEAHPAGSELGETERAIWAKQFAALRDGDRFFFGNDQGLSFIKNTYGIDFRHTLKEIITMDSGVTAADLPNPNGNVFFTPDANFDPATCDVQYTITNVASGTFTGNLAIKNTSASTISGWTVNFQLENGQTLQTPVAGAVFTQSSSNAGNNVTASNLSGNTNIAPGATITGVSFTGTWDNLTNAKPGNIRVNGKRCTVSLS